MRYSYFPIEFIDYHWHSNKKTNKSYPNPYHIFLCRFGSGHAGLLFIRIDSDECGGLRFGWLCQSRSVDFHHFLQGFPAVIHVCSERNNPHFKTDLGRLKSDSSWVPLMPKYSVKVLLHTPSHNFSLWLKACLGLLQENLWKITWIVRQPPPGLWSGPLASVESGLEPESYDFFWKLKFFSRKSFMVQYWEETWIGIPNCCKNFGLIKIMLSCNLKSV